MEHGSVPLMCWLLMLLFCEPTGAESTDVNVTVTSGPGGYKIICGDNAVLKTEDEKNVILPLKFKDENSMEYKCVDNNREVKIFVKFRTCDNCVELDTASISGLAVGNLIATIVIGVSVYLVASKGQFGSSRSSKKGSDQQHLMRGKKDSNYEDPRMATQVVYNELHHNKRQKAASK